MFLNFIGSNKKKIKLKLFDNESLKQAHKRIFFTISFFILIYLSIFFKLTDVMIVSNLFDKNKEIEKIDDKIKILNRGNIYDRNGEILATTIRSFSLSLRPNLIKNKKNVTNKLVEIFSFKKEDIHKKIYSNSNFIWLKKDISPKEHLKINNLGEIGLQIHNEKRRIYPHGSITSHLVGFTNIDEKPMSGIERGLNETLSNGEDVYLSVDLRLQYLVTEELTKAINKFNADGGVSIILDISSGQILASSSLPNFDPNNITLTSQKNLFNSFSQGVYEMGSTFKPITMAIGYDSNKISDLDEFEVNKPIKIGKYSINDHKPFDGSLNIREIIVKSSNIGAAKVAKLIGTETQKQYLKKFGLLEKQLLEIPETGSPLVPKPWRPVNTMTIGYGYGLSVSPLQLCSAYATLVNGGITVKSTYLRDNHTNYYQRVISEKTSIKVRELLRAVILETEWTGPKARVEGYEVGGKTGTAELIEDSQYHKKANLSSFIGVFPMSDPKYIILSMVRNPKGIEESYFNTTGAWVSAPIVSKIIKGMVNIFNIPPVDTKKIYKAELKKQKN